MRIKYLAFITIVAISCKPENSGITRFDPRELNENEIILSEIADNVIYIPFDNNISLGPFYKNIILTGNSIYLSTKENGILSFSRKGKFIRKIGSFGRGPGEYVYSYDVKVDIVKETIYNLDQNIIKVFSKSGNFLRTINLNEFGDNLDSFEVFNSKLFVFYKIQWSGFKYEWIILDTLGNLIKRKTSSIPSFSCEWGDPWLMFKCDNYLSYWNPFTDTVFSFLPDLTKKVSFIVSPGEHRMPRSKIYTFENYNKYLHPKWFLETKGFLVLVFAYKKPYLILIDKSNNDYFLITLDGDYSGDALFLTGGMINDLDGGARFLPKAYYTENNKEYLIGLQYPHQIKTRIASDDFKNLIPKYPEKKKELEKLAASLKETDNPVLILVRLKEGI